MSTALIADDERLMREQLRGRLREVWPELEIVAEAKNGQEAVLLTEQLHPDVVFLDIRMPVLTGVDAARQIAQLATHEEANGWPGCEIVFITAYDQYAVQAFDQGVVDYVLKPAERERLLVTVQRIQSRMAQRARQNQDRSDGLDAAVVPMPTHTPDMQQLLQRLAAQINPKSQPKLQWIQATVRQAIQMIPVEDVLFFISDEKYTRVQTTTQEALIRTPIKDLVEQIDMTLFWQIHRSTLVNVKAISGVSRDERGRQLVSVRGHGEKLEVSRSYAGLFRGM
jgi:DNA-binding LytR/AlgR family response regulator